MARDTGASIVAMKTSTGLCVIFTCSTSKPRRTFADKTMWHVTGNSTGPSVTTRSAFTAIKYSVTVLACVSSATLAAIVVGELDAAVCASRVTGVGQALIDISFTALPHISRGAYAVIAPDSIHTFSFVETLGLFSYRVGKWVAVINVDLTMNTLGSPGTGAFVGIDQVNAGAPVLAWLGETFIDLIRAVGPHKAWHALACVSTQKVSAGGSILARVWITFIHLLLTITPRVSHLAVAVVNISCIETLARVSAQLGNINPSLFGSHLTGNTWDITVKSTPACLTLATIGSAPLPAGSSIFARRGVTPANQILTVKSSVSMWASALVSAIAVMTSATIQARLRVTFVDIMLAVVASKSWGTDACEGIDAIYTGSTVEARTLSAVRSVIFTVDATEPRWASTGIAVHTVSAVGSVFTWVAFTLIDVLLTLGASKTGQAGTHESIHLILTDSSVTARVRLAVINVRFTVASGEAWSAATAITA